MERLERVGEIDGSPETLGAVAAARNELADILERSGKTDESRDQLQRSIDILSELARQGEATWAQRRALAKGLHLMAGYPDQSLLGQTSSGKAGELPYDPVRGETYLRDALELRQQLVSERPDDHAVLGNLADTAQRLGGTLARREDTESGQDPTANRNQALHRSSVRHGTTPRRESTAGRSPGAKATRIGFRRRRPSYLRAWDRRGILS